MTGNSNSTRKTTNVSFFQRRIDQATEATVETAFKIEEGRRRSRRDRRDPRERERKLQVSFLRERPRTSFLVSSAAGVIGAAYEFTNHDYQTDALSFFPVCAGRSGRWNFGFGCDLTNL